MVTPSGKDRKNDLSEPPAAPLSGPAQAAQPEAASATGRSASQLKALTELDEPSFGYSNSADLFAPALLTSPPVANENAQAQPALAFQLEDQGLASLAPPAADETGEYAQGFDLHAALPSDSAAVQDSDADALTSDTSAVLAASRSAPEPNVSTRPHTHVGREAWFDSTLDLPHPSAAPSDARQRLAWRFKAAFSAYKLLLPTSPTPEARALMVNALRRYERLLRAAVAVPRDSTKQVTEALHAQLSDQQTVELDRAMSELEGALLTLDECLTNEQFRTRFGKQHQPPKMLLRYARFLAARRFGIGYRRDRFEQLAQELLTAKLPSGNLLLMPRKRAAPILVQLVRGLFRPMMSPDAQEQELQYLRDALDRLQSLAGPKQFFDSGFYLDVYGYKISMHDRITSPEFLYLCVAINVEVHNRLQAWSQLSGEAAKAGSSGSLAALHVQLRAQQEAAQAVFADFHRPLAGTAPGKSPAPAAKKGKRPGPQPTGTASSVLRLAAACAFVVGVAAVNLYVLGFVQFESQPVALAPENLQALSPLLINGRLSEGGRRFQGLISRPNWHKLSPRERQEAAAKLAASLKAQGIDHAEVLAYKSRAIQVNYGSVVYVDDAK